MVVIWMLIDTHCHIEHNYYDNLEDIIHDISKSDVKIIIVSGYVMLNHQTMPLLFHTNTTMYMQQLDFTQMNVKM